MSETVKLFVQSITKQSKNAQFSTTAVRPDIRKPTRLRSTIVLCRCGARPILPVTYAPTSIALRVCRYRNFRSASSGTLATDENDDEKGRFSIGNVSGPARSPYGFDFGKRIRRRSYYKSYLLRAKTIRPITGLSLIISLTMLSIIGPNSWRKFPCGRRLEELKCQQLF